MNKSTLEEKIVRKVNLLFVLVLLCASCTTQKSTTAQPPHHPVPAGAFSCKHLQRVEFVITSDLPPNLIEEQRPGYLEFIEKRIRSGGGVIEASNTRGIYAELNYVVVSSGGAITKIMLAYIEQPVDPTKTEYRQIFVEFTPSVLYSEDEDTDGRYFKALWFRLEERIMARCSAKAPFDQNPLPLQ